MNIISKKKDIIELLKKGTDVEEICTDLGVSTSYVYRIKREMDELEGNEEDPANPKENSSDDLVVTPSGRDSNDVEGDNENVEEKENEPKTDETNGLGGVKRKKRAKKVKKDVKKDEDTDERTGGLIKWMKKQWKKILLILTLSILLVAMILSSSLTKNREPEKPQIPSHTIRFPSINH